MLKQLYTTETEVPTELKSFYALRDGKYVLQVEGIESISGLVAKRDELLGKVSGHATELGTKDSELTRLSGELANAKGSSLPRGHKAVPTADADLLDSYKALGAPDELKTVKTEHGTFKTESEQRSRRDSLRAAAIATDYEPEAFIRLPNLPEIEVRDSTEKDDKGALKKVAIAKIKTGDVITEKPLKEFLESSDEHKPLLRALVLETKPDGTPLPSHGAGGGSTSKDPIAERNKVREAARAANPNPLMPKAVSA